MNCWPSVSLSFANTRRATVSLSDPGAFGTITRTGLIGYSCACSGVRPNASVSATLEVIRQVGANDLCEGDSTVDSTRSQTAADATPFVSAVHANAGPTQ